MAPSAVTVCRLVWPHYTNIRHMEMISDLTCPACGFVERLAMPADACVFFHECTACQTLLRPLQGHCCVFCSYGSIPCPPIQGGCTDCCAPEPEASPDESARLDQSARGM